jgi:alpha-L-rhamnosidase
VDCPANVLSRIVALEGPVPSASLFATELSKYEVLLNCVRVGDTEPVPGLTNYDRTGHAQSHDVTPVLRAGVDRMEIVLSDGWHAVAPGSDSGMTGGAAPRRAPRRRSAHASPAR